MNQKRDIFLEVLENNKGIIFKVVNSYCKDEVDRQDLAQEIIIQLWLSFENYNSQYKISTWVYRIALNTSISFYRKSKTRKEKTVDFSSILETTLTADEPFHENPDVKILQHLIHKLKEIDKALILLYLDGVNQKEIAQIVGITPTNVSSKILRIKKNLSQKLQTIKGQNHER